MAKVDELRGELMNTLFGLRQAAATPVAQFGAWFEQAKTAGLYQPRAATLATVNALGQPTARVIVLTGFGPRGFDFTTDGRSPKAEDLRRWPWAALVFYWAELERQVRLEGPVQPLDPTDARAYFERRAPDSQLAALASRQSEVIADRALVEERLLRLLADHAGGPVAPPPDLAGFRLSPTLVEFWQGRADRLNDRVRYRLSEDKTWIIELLSP